MCLVFMGIEFTDFLYITSRSGYGVRLGLCGISSLSCFSFDSRILVSLTYNVSFGLLFLYSLPGYVGTNIVTLVIVSY